MQIKKELPPNYETINKVLKTTKNTIYCYGDTIYNPSGKNIMEDLMVHEEVHSKQQATTGMGVENWWKIYLEDPRFRLNQEIEAYKAQVKYAKNNYQRWLRKKTMEEIVIHLSSDLYGSLITKEEAKRIIYE